MRILISNDDGVHSEGINLLRQTLSTLAEIIVVAPDRDRSGASNSLSLGTPLSVHTIEDGIISVNGTPTDCVHMAITGLLDKPPDMVVSGINHGANLGDDILYSGTVAAAMEGRYLGLPAVAFSLVEKESAHLHTACVVAKQIVTSLMRDPLPATTILNVNIPDVPLAEIRGRKVTRLGTRHRAERVTMRTDPTGKSMYWIGPAGPEADAGPGTDFYAIRNNCVSITPLQLDMTDYQSFNQLASWLGRLDETD